MQKICKRYGFKTPSARAICQVCGSTKFATSVTESVNRVPVIAEFTAINTFREFVQATFESSSKFMSSAMDKLMHSKECISTSETLQRSQALVSGSSYAAEAIAVEQSLEGKTVEEMIAWFKSYGVDQPLILQPGNRRSSESTHDLISKAA